MTRELLKDKVGIPLQKPKDLKDRILADIENYRKSGVEAGLSISFNSWVRSACYSKLNQNNQNEQSANGTV